MNAERWQEVQRMFEQAVAWPTAEREQFLTEACGEDRALHHEVTSLLRADAEAGERIAEAVEAGEALLLEDGRERAKAVRFEDLAFGKYEVEAKIGEGGFGVVYRGRDPVLKRTVAIKACGSLDVGVRRRFFREGQIAAGLQHVNIVTVHELGVEAGVPYLVQEFLDGEDLRQLLAREVDLSLARKLDILLQVARGLQHAHRAGVLHRDVKPGNILVLSEGAVKILDFGIAKLLDAESQLTGTGVTLGTVGYLAPEQMRSEAIDQRADIFSFGVLAYELLSGQRPFKGENFSQVSYQLLYVEPQALEELWLECPPALGGLVRGCLEKDLARRVGGFGAVIRELEEMLGLLSSGGDLAGKPVMASARADGTRSDSELLRAQAATRLLPSSPPRHWPQVAGGLLLGLVLVVFFLRFRDAEPAFPPVEEKSVVEVNAVKEPVTVPLLSEVTDSSGSSKAAVDRLLVQPMEEAEKEVSVADTPLPGPVVQDVPPAQPEQGGEPTAGGRSPPEAVPIIPQESVAEETPPRGSENPGEPPPLVSPEKEPKLQVAEPPEAPIAEGSHRVEAAQAASTMHRGDLLTSGPGVEPPSLIDRPQPVYPRRARRRNKEARVVVKVLVDEEGKVLQAIAPPDDDGFGEAAREAALGARFEPAVKDGIAGKMWRNLPFEFKVE